MDKNAIKKYAVWARNELIARVTQKAEQFEISAERITSADADSVNGRLLTEAEKKQRKALLERINATSFEQVIEEVAYTWFNRFAALRFMEVNGYLPSHVRVFTDDENQYKPQILTEAIHLELDGVDKEKVYALKEADKTEELFKYLLIAQCNALSSILPGMFQKIEDYTELLLPDNLLREGSVIEQMIALIPEEDWTDQVQIIGWLYQYYNTEPKDKVFADLKKNIKISKENIPAVTQLFTPDWIVRYMVENSLGRLWLEGHPNGDLRSGWKYYLDEAEQEPEVQKQLDEIRKEYAALKPEDIRCIDPCMGSGHILCYLFDVLIQIYEDYGYPVQEAAASIVEKNLWGLDIDERAAQLSYFAVMMKARQYDRLFFSQKLQPHVYVIEESNGIASEILEDLGNDLSPDERTQAIEQVTRLIEEMTDAKEYGSIISVTSCDWELLRRFAVPQTDSDGQMKLAVQGELEIAERLQSLIHVGEMLAQTYHAVVTNPPYMSASGMEKQLSDYVKKKFPDSKADLFAVCMEVCNALAKEKGFVSMITQHSWMFLSSFERLREKIRKETIVNMAHLGARAFEEIGGEVVQTTSFVLQNARLENYAGKYARLVEPTTQQGKEEMFWSGENRFSAEQSNFEKIPGAPIAYWINNELIRAFEKGRLLKEIGSPRVGLQTSNNDKFIRYWFEVVEKDFFRKCNNVESSIHSKKRWYPHNKGGAYRKWYGNQEYIILYEHNGKLLKETPGAATIPENIVFKYAITFSRIGSGAISFREQPEGSIFDSAAVSLFPEDYCFYYLLGFLNTKIVKKMIEILAPTMNTQPGDVAKIPILFCERQIRTVELLVKNCIRNAKKDWDSFETSWDFQSHPLVPKEPTLLSEQFQNWTKECDDRFTQLKANEEELNRIFIDIYGLQDELTPEVEDKDVTVRRADLQRDIKSLISYAVGCMFGRYSLDEQGLAYAGGEWDAEKYRTFLPDADAIIPICDDEYFEDDIVGRFVEFVETVYGKETLEENLQFVADALGGKGTSREIIRSYFLNDFYADHVKTYQKRPIYWLFDSGKKNGFKCLIYLHRYQPDTIARIRTDYVHAQQSRYRTMIEDLEQRVSTAATADRVKLNKQLQKLQAQAVELRDYEEKIHHLADQMIALDLDDGVKVNYAKLQDVLAKIK